MGAASVGGHELAQSLEGPLVALIARAQVILSRLLLPTLPPLYLAAELPQRKKMELKEWKSAKRLAKVHCMANRWRQRQILLGHARVLPEVAQEVEPLASASANLEAHCWGSDCQWEPSC